MDDESIMEKRSANVITDLWTSTNQTITTYPTGALVLSITSCSLSVIGGIIIFVTYFTIPEIRNFTRKLMLCLTAADILTAGGYLISGIKYSVMGALKATNVTSSTDHHVCEIQGGITTYSSLVSFFLTVIIAAHILATVVSRKNRTGTVVWLVAFNVISWGVPAIIIAVALYKGAIGEDKSKDAGTGPWCWIRSGVAHQYVWMWVTGKGWEIACYLLTTTLYMTLKFYMYLRHHKERFKEIQCSLRDDDKNFLYVWLLLYIMRMWGTLRFFLFVYMEEHPQKLMSVLLYLQALGDPAQSFCNFFLFCVLDTTVRAKFFGFVNGRTEKEQETETLFRDYVATSGSSTNESVTRSCDLSRDMNSQSAYGTFRGGNSRVASYSTGSVTHWKAMRERMDKNVIA